MKSQFWRCQHDQHDAVPDVLGIDDTSLFGSQFLQESLHILRQHPLLTGTSHSVTASRRLKEPLQLSPDGCLET